MIKELTPYEVKHMIYKHGKTMTEQEALVIMDALDKQIPKKRIEGKWNIKSCPNCGNVHLGYDNQWNYKFCPDCGQAIDWECDSTVNKSNEKN